MDRKEMIITIFEQNYKGIAIDPIEFRNDISKITKINYPNFKYDGQKTIRDNNTGKEKDVWFIKITNIPNNLILAIKDTINDKLNNSSLSVTEILNEIIDYFKKMKFKKELEKELFGDLGEAIFIYKTLINEKINLIPYLRNNDSDLYDFSKDSIVFEVKSSSLEKNEFVITHEQLNQIKDKKIIICKFKKLEGETDILKLYDLISEITPLNDLLLEKKRCWSILRDELISNNESDIISNYSVILENCKLSLFKDNNLPDVDIKQMNACKSIKYHINCTDSELLDIHYFYKILKQ